MNQLIIHVEQVDLVLDRARAGPVEGLQTEVPPQVYTEVELGQVLVVAAVPPLQVNNSLGVGQDARNVVDQALGPHEPGGLCPEELCASPLIECTDRTDANWEIIGLSRGRTPHTSRRRLVSRYRRRVCK